MNDALLPSPLEQAISLQNAGHSEEAKKIFLRIVSLEPNNVAALYSLAVLYYNHQDAEKALTFIDRALAIRNDLDYFYETRNTILKKIGPSIEIAPIGATVVPDSKGAADASNETISLFINKEKTRTLSDVVSACDELIKSSQTEKAIVLYRDYIHRGESDAFLAQFNLGALHSSLNEQGMAAACYEDIVKKVPGFVPAYMNLGTVYEKAGKPKNALDIWEKALSLPDLAKPENREEKTKFLNNLGRLNEIERDYEKAEHYLYESLKVDDTQSPPLQHWFHLRQKQYKWPVLTDESFCKKPLHEIISPLASLAYVRDPALQRACAERFVRDTVKMRPRRVETSRRYYHDKVRIGYASSDLSMHAVSLLTVELFEKHDRSKFDIHALCWSPEDGTPFRRRVRSAFDHYHAIGHLSDDEAADLIQSLEIDVLVDLQGLSGRARPNLIAQGAAPIQIAYLGFPGTTCLPYVDYVVADEFLFPPELKPHFSEEPLYLDTLFQVSDSKRQFGQERSRSFYGLPEDQFVFCSFNNAYKYSPDMITLWASILNNCPRSILWLLEDNVWSKANLLADFKKHGIESERIYFAGRIDPRDYLSRFKAADLFLDTCPYNAGTTANDALFAGLPVLTLSGQTYVSRMAGALLHRLGLDPLITFNGEAYCQTAIALAQDRNRLDQYKNEITSRVPIAFNTETIARNFESKILNLLGRS